VCPFQIEIFYHSFSDYYQEITEYFLEQQSPIWCDNILHGTSTVLVTSSHLIVCPNGVKKGGKVKVPLQ
jgi:hypothetical protein